MVYIAVGRKVECRWEQAPGTTNTHHDWNFGASAVHIVRNYDASNANAIITPMTNWRASHEDALNLYMISGGDYPFTSTLTYFIHSERDHPLHEKTKQGVVKIAKPDFEPGAIVHNPIYLEQFEGPGGVGGGWIRVGRPWTGAGFAFEGVVRFPALPEELADGAGRVGFVQLLQCTYEYRTNDGREMRYSTGAEFMLDSEIPYDNDYFAITQTEPAEASIEDSPCLPLYPFLNKAVLELSFKTYLMYKSNYADSVWVALGSIDWSAETTALKEDDVWELEDPHMVIGTWVTSSELPTWARNDSVIDTAWNAERQRVLTPEERALENMVLPLDEIKRHRGDYRAYVGTYRESEGSWEAFKKDFELRFHCVISFAGAQRFHTWILPEVAQRAQGYRTASLTEVPPGDKWMHRKATYIPPFGWETQWTLHLAPVCFAANDEKSLGYWSAFTDLTPNSLAAALQSKLSRMTVTCDRPSRFGRFPLTFSRPLWEEDMNALASLPFVFYMEPKQHFGEKLLNLVTYFQGRGQIVGRDGYWIGEKGASTFEGFLIDPMTSDLTVEYMAHISNFGDTGWFQQRQIIGETSGNRAIEGFAIRLTGNARNKYNLSYRAYVHGTGDTGIVQGDQFCGTRGQSRPIEAIEVMISRKSSDDPIVS